MAFIALDKTTPKVAPTPSFRVLDTTPVPQPPAPTLTNKLEAGVSQGFNDFIKSLINGAQTDASMIKNAFTSGISQANQGSLEATNADTNLVQRGEGVLNFGAGLANATFAPLAPIFSPIGQLINLAGEQLAKTPYLQEYGKAIVNAPPGTPGLDTPDRILQAIQNVTTIGQAVLGSGLLKGKEVPTKLPVESVGTETPIPVHNGEIPLPVENAPTVPLEELPKPPSPPSDLEGLKTELSIYQDALDNDPAKELLKYYGKNDPRYSNLDDIFSRNVGKAKSGTLDSIVQELGYNGVQEAHDAVIQYLDTKDRVAQIKSEIAGNKPLTQPRSTTQTLKPIEGTGQLKTRGLSQNVEASAIEKQLADNFGDLPEYRTVNLSQQAQLASDFLTKDLESAKAVAMGTKAPPKGILPESVFVALERKATEEGDVVTLRDLANSKLASSATTMGQRIRTLGERDSASPLKAIQDVQEARARAQANRVQEEVAQAQKVIRNSNTVKSWAEFVDSITC